MWSVPCSGAETSNIPRTERGPWSPLSLYTTMVTQRTVRTSFHHCLTDGSTWERKLRKTRTKTREAMHMKWMKTGLERKPKRRGETIKKEENEKGVRVDDQEIDEGVELR